MKFYGELLVFALLFITNLRVFFVHHVRRDPLVVLAPFTFIVAIFQILAWGIDAFTTLGLLIALFVLLSNFHAIFRYIERLYVDHYSALMKVWAVFTILISAVALVATIYFAPVESSIRKRNYSVASTYYKGSFRSGFVEAGAFDSKALTIFEFGPKDDEDSQAEKLKAGNNNSQTAGTQTADLRTAGEPSGIQPLSQDLIILLSPDKRGGTEHYKPYLCELAARGYKVYSADFFADDGLWLHNLGDRKIFRRIVMVLQSAINRQHFEAQQEYYSFNISQEYEVLIPLLRERCGSDKKILLLTDFMADIAADDFAKKNPELIAGVLKLSAINEYKTSGYGCVEQTDPLLAISLGLHRDKTLKTPKLLADRTEEVLKQLQHDTTSAETLNDLK